jgi:hypothetical protein
VKDVHVVTFINICVVFFISGLTLNTDQLKNALTKRTITGTIFAFVSIIGLTPLLGFATRHLPLQPATFATGLTIFCVVPTTLGVGVSLVTSAKVSLFQVEKLVTCSMAAQSSSLSVLQGNVALAIFLTVGTNILGACHELDACLNSVHPFAVFALVMCFSHASLQGVSNNCGTLGLLQLWHQGTNYRWLTTRLLRPQQG